MKGVADGPQALFEAAGGQRRVLRSGAREAASRELALDDRVVGVKPAVKRRDAGRAAVSDERPPERSSCKSRLDARLERGDGRGVAPASLGGAQPLQRVADAIRRGRGRSSASASGRRRSSGVVVADHSGRLAAQAPQERRPVRGTRGRERLKTPQARPVALIAHRGEDVKDDPAAGDGLAVRAERLDAEREVVEDKRALGGPVVRTVPLENDRREELDPVRDELAVRREPRVARVGVGAQPPRALASDARRALPRPSNFSPPRSRRGSWLAGSS